MPKAPYTKAELREFDRLTLLCSSMHQVKRIEGRMALSKFIAEHGKEKCDLMFKALTE